MTSSSSADATGVMSSTDASPAQRALDAHAYAVARHRELQAATAAAADAYAQRSTASPAVRAELLAAVNVAHNAAVEATAAANAASETYLASRAVPGLAALSTPAVAALSDAESVAAMMSAIDLHAARRGVIMSSTSSAIAHALQTLASLTESMRRVDFRDAIQWLEGALSTPSSSTPSSPYLLLLSMHAAHAASLIRAATTRDDVIDAVMHVRQRVVPSVMAVERITAAAAAAAPPPPRRGVVADGRGGDYDVVVGQLMTAAAFALARVGGGGGGGGVGVGGNGDSTENPYADLLTPHVLVAIERLFRETYLSECGLAGQSPLETVVSAGAIALPTMARMVKVQTASSASSATQTWPTQPQLAVPVPLPPQFAYHSVFVCPVSKEMPSGDNVPMILPCGHCLLRDSIKRLPIRHADHSFKCPYCPKLCRQSDAKPVNF